MTAMALLTSYFVPSALLTDRWSLYTCMQIVDERCILMHILLKGMEIRRVNLHNFTMLEIRKTLLSIFLP